MENKQALPQPADCALHLESHSVGEGVLQMASGGKLSCPDVGVTPETGSEAMGGKWEQGDLCDCHLVLPSLESVLEAGVSGGLLSGRPAGAVSVLG